MREIERFPRPHDGMSDVVTGQSYTPGIHKDSPFIDQYQGLIDGEWVDVDQVRVIRTPTQPGRFSMRVGVVTIPADDDEG